MSTDEQLVSIYIGVYIGVAATIGLIYHCMAGKDSVFRTWEGEFSEGGFVAFCALWPLVVIGLLIISIFEDLNAESRRQADEREVKRRADDRNRIRQRGYIRNKALKYQEVLGRKRLQLRTTDDYGDIDDLAWNKELAKFWNSKIGSVPGEYALKFAEDEHIPIEEIFEVIDKVAAKAESRTMAKLKYDDEMDGIEYEHYVSNLLTKKGWKTKVLKASGDQGVDVLAKRKGDTVAIQCKKHASPVGNKAVQEVVSGKIHYGAGYAAVVTNSKFTPAAKKLAATTGVELLHHSELDELLSLLRK